MNEDDLPKNSWIIQMELLDDGTLRTAFGHRFDEDEVEDRTIQFLIDVLHGIRISLDAGMENFAQQGAMARTIRELIEDPEDDYLIDFEPDEKLLEALKDKRGNVIKFDPRKKQ
jgi:transcriptional antiterminator